MSRIALYAVFAPLLLASPALGASAERPLSLSDVDRSEDTQFGGWTAQHFRNETGVHHRFTAMAPSGQADVFAWLRCTDELGFRLEILRSNQKRHYEPDVPVIVTIDKGTPVPLAGMEHLWSKNYEVDVPHAEAIEDKIFGGHVLSVTLKGRTPENLTFMLHDLAKAREAVLAVCPARPATKHP